ncbi:MAG: hypothetical protein E7488_05190 [Ruminococcaceae bacterium]|nr:hypothetical protein [Oscillospiraceae bacterium]
MKKENSFVKAGVVLVVSGFVVKLLSAVYRIPLTRMLGAAQMGRYSALFSLFMPFFSFATAGIVPCISHCAAKLNSCSKAAVLKKTAAKLYISWALVLSVLFVAFSFIYSKLQNDSLFFTGGLILAPAVVLAAVENICKGLTQGRMNMLPTATANVLESVSKTVFGLAGVYFAREFFAHTVTDATVKAGLSAVTVSGFLCCAYLLWMLKRADRAEKKNIGGKNRYILQTKNGISKKELFRMSFPIAVSALVISLSGFFDTAVCLPRISRIPYRDIVQSFEGASFKNAEDMPMYLLGIYQGMVMTVFNLLPAVLSYIGTASLPVISRAMLPQNSCCLKRQTRRLFAVTAGISVPVTVYIFFFRYDILRFLFGTNGAQTRVSAQLLGILLCSSVFCCFTSVFNSVLYAAGKSSIVFRILFIASVAKCTVNYILCAVPQINIKAFAVSACVFHAIIFILSIINVKKTGVEFSFSKIFFKPCAATAVAIFIVILLTDTVLCYLPPVLKLGFSGVIYSLIYFLIAIIWGFLLISPSENSNI